MIISASLFQLKDFLILSNTRHILNSYFNQISILTRKLICLVIPTNKQNEEVPDYRPKVLILATREVLPTLSTCDGIICEYPQRNQRLCRQSLHFLNVGLFLGLTFCVLQIHTVILTMCRTFGTSKAIKKDALHLNSTACGRNTKKHSSYSKILFIQDRQKPQGGY